MHTSDLARFAAALIYSGIFWSTTLFLFNACALNRSTSFAGVGVAVGVMLLTAYLFMGVVAHHQVFAVARNLS